MRVMKKQTLGSGIIHCLMCDDTYPEKEQVVTICPTCGNDDLSETVYVQNEEVV